MTTSGSGSRLKRKRRPIDILEVKDGELNAVRNAPLFLSQGKRQMAAAAKQEEEKRKKLQRAAEQRREKEKAERATRDLQARQRQAAATIAGNCVDLTQEIDDAAKKCVITVDESELVSEIDDSDFESTAPTRSANATPPRESSTSNGEILLDDSSEDEADTSRAILHKENASAAEAPSKMPTNRTKPSVGEGTEDIVVISSDEEEDPSPKRSRPFWQSGIKNPKLKSRKAKTAELVPLNVQGNALFSNPLTNPSSSELLKKSTGRVSGLKTRQYGKKDKNRSPLKEINKQGSRASKKPAKQKQTVFKNLSAASAQLASAAVKQPHQRRPLLGEVLSNRMAEQQRQRGVHRFDRISHRKSPIFVNLEADEKPDVWQKSGLQKTRSPDKAKRKRISRSAGRENMIQKAISLSGQTTPGHVVPVDKQKRNKRLEPLSIGEENLVKKLTIKVPKRKVMATVKCANITLRGEDFSCLRGCRWLNDELMNSFAALINERNKTFFAEQENISSCEASPGLSEDVVVHGSDVPMHHDPNTTALFQRKRPRVHVFNTFFYTRLTTNGYDYDGVRRWPNRAGVKVTEMDLIMFPINLNNFHWVLAFIDLRSKQFVYCDSMYGHDHCDVLKTLRRWLLDEVTHKFGQQTALIMDIANWSCLENPKYLPQQRDAGSCGVFALYTADYLEVGQKPDFTQEDIRILRQRTALFLTKNKLVPR